MKGVILAGGTGARLSSLCGINNKHLLIVGQEPMVFNPLRQLVSADIDDILVVTGKEHMRAMTDAFQSAPSLGLRTSFKAQNSPLGIAHALSLAEDFAGGDRLVVILGDNISTRSIAPYVHRFEAQDTGARILVHQVDTPQDFGVAVFDGSRITRIVEKPTFPPSEYAVLGYYMYDSQVFDFIRSVKPSARGEFEITDLNNLYAQRKQLEYDILEGEWIDAGTVSSYKRAHQLLLHQGNDIQITH